MYFRLVRGRYTITSNMILSSNAHLVLFNVRTDGVDLILFALYFTAHPHCFLKSFPLAAAPV